MATLFFSYGTQNINSTYTTAITATSAKDTVVLSILITNTSSTDAANIYVRHGRSGTYTMISNMIPLSVGGTIDILNSNKIILQASDIIQVRTDNASVNVDVLISTLEQ